MCYDVRSSLQAFFFSQIIGWVGVYQRLYWLSFMIITFSMVQLIDTFLWISQKNQKMNDFISRFILPTVFVAEIVVAYYLGPWRNKIWESGLFIFCIVMFSMWIILCQKPSIPGEDGYLFWCQMESRTWSKLFMFLFLVGPFAIAYPNKMIRVLIVIIATITFVHSFSKQNWGTHWCYTSNILAFVLLGEIVWNQLNKK